MTFLLWNDNVPSRWSVLHVYVIPSPMDYCPNGTRFYVNHLGVSLTTKPTPTRDRFRNGFLKCFMSHSHLVEDYFLVRYKNVSLKSYSFTMWSCSTQNGNNLHLFLWAWLTAVLNGNFMLKPHSLGKHQLWVSLSKEMVTWTYSPCHPRSDLGPFNWKRCYYCTTLLIQYSKLPSSDFIPNDNRQWWTASTEDLENVPGKPNVNREMIVHRTSEWSVLNQIPVTTRSPNKGETPV